MNSLSPRALFPLTASLAFAFAASLLASEETTADEVLLGSGAHTYRWEAGWPQVPEGRELGNTHGGIAFDSDGLVYLNTDTEEAVMVFGPDGTHVRSFGKEWKGGLHGMQMVKEDEDEYLLVAHTTRHQVARMSLKGDVAWSIGWPEASGKYASEAEFKPTSVARAPDGRIFVADGYGKSWIHIYDAERKYMSSFGGPGSEPGQLRTPHGVWVDTRGEEPVLLVADRENHRVQSFDLDGAHIAVFDVELRRPCTVYQRGDELVISDLAGRVTILDAQNELVAHLGDQPDPELRARNGIPRDKWAPGQFLSPHSAAWDARGDLYVMDWNSLGRVTKLARVEAPK